MSEELTRIEMREHYGWVDMNGDSPYDHVRKGHHFLTDDNHDYEDTGEIIIIYRNENSSEQHPITPAWARGQKYWFSLQYRQKASHQ